MKPSGQTKEGEERTVLAIETTRLIFNDTFFNRADVIDGHTFVEKAINSSKLLGDMEAYYGEKETLTPQDIEMKNNITLFKLKFRKFIEISELSDEDLVERIN